MHTRETFKKNVEKEIRGVQVRLLEFRTKAEKAHATNRSEYKKLTSRIERHIKATKAHLIKLDEADEHTWEQLRNGVTDAWSTLQDSLQDAISKFEGKN